MVYFILVKKINQQSNLHYYSVFKDNNAKDINYYMGIDSTQKRIFFYEELSQNACTTYDLLTDKFDTCNEQFLHRINGRVMIKAHAALSNNNFPQSLSWES